jgi:succinate dehydrogenase flavin-adding protein (antitoxin of CptAB toxin-antitoxin module)
MLELDLILAPFIAQQYQTLSPAELTNLADFLQATDVELYAWLTEREPAPAEFTDMVNKLIAYARRDVR